MFISKMTTFLRAMTNYDKVLKKTNQNRHDTIIDQSKAVLA